MLYALCREALEVDRGFKAELGDEEGEVLEAEQQARAADVRVEEGRLIHRRRRAVHAQARVDEGGADDWEVGADLEPGGVARVRERVQKRALPGVLVAQE